MSPLPPASSPAGPPALPPAGPPSDAAMRPSFGLRRAAPDTVFFGPSGLRAGWGILLFFCAAGLFGSVFYRGLFKLAGLSAAFGRESQPASAHAAGTLLQLPDAFLNELSQVAAILLTALGLGRLERRPFAAFGLPRPDRRNFVLGAASGLVLLSLLVGLLHALHLLVFDRRLLNAGAALRFGLGWLAVFLLVGLFEEFLFRGYLQSTLTRGLMGLGRRLSPANPHRTAFWLAAVFWSLFFLVTHLHNAGENPFGLLAVFVAGLVFSHALWRTGSLWWSIGFHAAWDWAQSFLYGVPDSGILSAHRLLATHPMGSPILSGGADGPEGSLFVLPIFLLVPALLVVLPSRPLLSAAPAPDQLLPGDVAVPRAEQPAPSATP